MRIQKRSIICCIYHIGWSNDHIWFSHTLNKFKVFRKCCNIGIINIVFSIVFTEKKLKFTTFGVDVVMTSCSKVFCQGTWFTTYIYLNTVNAAVAHVGNRKIDGTISSKERKCTDRTIVLHSFYFDVSPGRCNDSKCSCHIILPPLHVWKPVRYVRCQQNLLWLLCRSLHYRQPVLSVQRHRLLLRHQASEHCQ